MPCKTMRRASSLTSDLAVRAQAHAPVACATLRIHGFLYMDSIGQPPELHLLEDGSGGATGGESSSAVRILTILVWVNKNCTCTMTNTIGIKEK